MYLDLDTAATFSVVEDTRKPLRGRFGPLRGTTSLTLTIRDIIEAASRYMYVRGKSRPERDLVHEWKVILAWHLQTFWDVDMAVPMINTAFSSQSVYSSEHHKWSGEHMAGGVSLLLASRLPSVRVARCEFFAGGGLSRPDFVLPIHVAKKRMVGVEARLRQHSPKLSMQYDIKPITDKKVGARAAYGFQNILGVILQYGPPYKTRPESRSRIVIFDQEEPVDPIPAIRRRSAVLSNYERILQDAGLVSHAEIVQAVLQHILTHDGRFPPKAIYRFPTQLNPDDAQERLAIGNAIYAGRRFSVGSEGAVGSLGAHGFVGVNQEVLEIIQSADWPKLMWYRDLNEMTGMPGATILNDGYCSTFSFGKDSYQSYR
ncbi:MAG TPA: hypothetical protein VGF98_05315 [Candidatus Tumulicola sp.]